MDSKWVKWWKYPSVWKFFGVMFGTVVVSFLAAYFLPSIWNIVCVVIACGIGGFFGRKLGENALIDLSKEFFD